MDALAMARQILSQTESRRQYRQAQSFDAAGFANPARSHAMNRQAPHLDNRQTPQWAPLRCVFPVLRGYA